VHLFAYGTLQPGLAPAMIRAVVDRLTLVGAGTAPGTLYDLGEYPGAVFAHGAGPVHGRVYQLPADDEPAVLAAFDAYEGVPDLYERVAIDVALADGRTLTCWAYHYNHDPADHRPIPSGSYVREVRP